MRSAPVCLLALFVGACSDEPSALDGGGGENDAGTIAPDASAPDANVPDAGVIVEFPDAGPPTEATLPPLFVWTADALVGSTTATVGQSVECHINFIFELREEIARTPTQVRYRGVHGGDIARIILNPDGRGFAFFADAFGEVLVTLTLPDHLRIVIPLNETSENRFWRKLTVIEGRIDQNGVGSGVWACAPLDIEQGGYVDTEVVVEGTFTIEPPSEDIRIDR